jgi:hypothetical protein
MDAARVDLVIQFALVVAGRNDEWSEQALGPIHFIKYVYLADLAYGQRHDGETFTGAPWKFHHYGPWAPEVNDRIRPAVLEIDADERTVQSKFRDDYVRWTKRDDDLFIDLERRLPVEVASIVKRTVREYGRDTGELLHYVYATDPMRNAAPGERLVFEGKEMPPAAPQTRPPISVKQEKRYRERVAEARMRFAKKLSEVAASEPEMIRPVARYDALYEEGMTRLAHDAGAANVEATGEIYFDDSVWKSPTRRDRRE